MNNKLMPTMPILNYSDDGDSESSSLSPVPAFPKGDAGLEVPEHFKKPSFDTVESKNNSQVTVKLSKNGIEVVALRKGFYNQHRIRENDLFLVKSFEELGEWMKCVDPDLQKKHLENLKNKKAKK